MRLALPAFNPVKECQYCPAREEREVSAHILSYQIAHQLLKSVPGNIQVDGSRLILELDRQDPLHFDLRSGSLNTKNLSIPLEQRYKTEGLEELSRQVKEELRILEGNELHEVDPMHTLVIKLVEIFHARCGLIIHTTETQGEKTVWEIKLCENGPSGWIQSDGAVRNRFGEEANLWDWGPLRPEKLAAYVFGFNRFCRHYSSPPTSVH